MNQYIYVRPRDDGQGWAVDVYDGRRAWAKTHLGERPLNKAEAHRAAHKLRDPKFYSARTKRAVNSGAREGMGEARVGTMPGSGIHLPRPTPGRCSTRCDHDSQCTLSAGHGDRHETDHGCICYDPRRYGPFARENRKDDELRFAPHGASAAACAVCGWESMKRVAEGDGFVPICSTFCLQAWPRVRDLLADCQAYQRENAVLRSNSDHLSSENASLSSQVESMAMRIEHLAEELAKPEDVRLREVLDALGGRAVIFDGMGARVGHLLDEMDELMGRAGEAERTVEAARRRLACIAESMTEHVYQELASALEAPPRVSEHTAGDALGLRRGP